MNRHFYAFGVLLGLLASWMLAVGGSPSASAAKVAPRGALAIDREGDRVYCSCKVYDSGYAEGCGLDRSTGLVYDCAATAPAPVKLEVAKVQPAGIEPAAYDGHAVCDPAYDEAVYGDETLASVSKEQVESDEPPALLAAPWLSQEDREWQETLGYFESLVAKAKQPKLPHSFYDEHAAADYAAAELAAAQAAEAEEATSQVEIIRELTLPARQEKIPARQEREFAKGPRFSALIRTLPDSSLADDLRPVLIGLQVRGNWTLEKLGLADDLQTAIGLFTPRAAVENFDNLSWEDYNNFATMFDEMEVVADVVPGPVSIAPESADIAPEQASADHERIVAAAADILESFSRMSHHAAEELRRIARPRVAKSNTSETSGSKDR